jgi:hypothetical protein
MSVQSTLEVKENEKLEQELDRCSSISETHELANQGLLDNDSLIIVRKNIITKKFACLKSNN